MPRKDFDLNMKYDFDSYLLYESIPRSPLTVKVQIELAVDIDGEILKTAAQKAFCRYPYYRRTLRIDEEGAYVLEPSDANILVREEGAPCELGSAEANGLFFAVTYDKNSIYFNFSHSFCGGCGSTPWVKTTLWQYLTDAGYTISGDNIRLPDSEFEPGETLLPCEESFSTDEPLGEYRGTDSFWPVDDYMAAYKASPTAEKAGFYPVVIRKDALMEYARDNDGSPNSVISAVMFKMAARAFPDAEQISARIACNYRTDVNCPNTYRDLVRFLHVKYKSHMKDWEIQKLSTITRGSMYLQMERELGQKEYRKLMKLRDGIDSQTTTEGKRKYASEHSLLHKSVRDTYTVSYAGKVNWGGISPYIKAMYAITEGHLILEISALDDVFCISFMPLNQGEKYLKGFLNVLDEEGIPYQVGEKRTRNLPRIKI